MATHASGTIDARLDLRKNSLNFVRLILATLVIVSHAWPIGGFDDDPAIGDVTLGHLAVGGFFGISGYLIAQSRLSNSPGRFALKRALRILPGFWVCILVTGVGIAALASSQVGGWSMHDGLHYFASEADMWNGDKTIGATLDGAPFPIDWNGSLWTLRYEILCYLILGIGLAITAVRKSVAWPIAAFLGATAVTLALPSSAPAPIRDFAFLVPYFAAGTMLFSLSARARIDWRLAALAVGAFVAVALAGYGEALGALPVAYFCLWAGVVLPQLFQQIGAKNDISYGMYLYGFPVAQLLVAFDVPDLGVLLFTVLCILATIPFAAASWFLVENPAKNLAHRRTKGRRVAQPVR